MDIEISGRSGRAVEIRPSGELDLATAPDMQRVLAALVEQDVDRVIVDARGITFIDAAGLTPLIEAANSIDLLVRTPSHPVRRLLELTGTDGWMVEPGGTGSVP